MIGIGFVGSMGALYALHRVKPRYETRLNVADGIVQRCVHDSKRELAYAANVVCTTLMFVPGASLACTVAPFIVPSALATATSVFACSSWLALKLAARNGDAASVRWQAPLTAGLVSLVALQACGWLSIYVLGAGSGVTQLLWSVDMYAGVGIFTLLGGFDSYTAMRAYALGEPDEPSLALTLYNDLVILVMDFMRIFVRNKVNSV
jgi:FtsH-binding integral membrane protein